MNIIRELRKKAGIQQKELALIVGVSQPTLSDWEKGKKDPAPENLKKLAEYFNVDELVILGKGVVDLTRSRPEAPRTVEARIVSAGMDKMPKADREFALEMFQRAFSKYMEEGDNADEA